ncbi:MAG TPA: hypothetical protein VLA43_09665, partial [Longimicrobiales bacterium]|nr:hypothetical protein [Longimicrobiales bacterium]
LLRKLLLPALVLVLQGCDDGPVAAGGTLTVHLRSPNPAEGAARIQLVGRGMGTATALEGEVHTRTRGDTLEVLVLRPDPGILRFALQVEDTTRRPTGTVMQVAGPENTLRSGLAGYVVEVVR